jgi:hypothetical protein
MVADGKERGGPVEAAALLGDERMVGRRGEFVEHVVDGVGLGRTAGHVAIVGVEDDGRTQKRAGSGCDLVLQADAPAALEAQGGDVARAAVAPGFR